MAACDKASEEMEASTMEILEVIEPEAENSSKAADKASDGTAAKLAGRVASIKKNLGCSNVSPSYSQLQSGLKDIVKNYVAKAPAMNKGASGSNAKPEEEKKSEETNGKRKKDDSDNHGEDERTFFEDFLDRTKSDYYCKVCDSHMNSEQMWENHVQGKRHLKNIKKDPGEPPSKVKAVRTDLIPKIVKTLDQIREPVVGLDYMCELQRAESYLDPSYSCFLCHATCTVSSVIDHILGTKHRLAYLKEANPSEYNLVEEMKLKKSGLTSIAEDYAREYERKRGRGRMEVKIEKPKMAPPPSKKERRYLDDSDDEYIHHRRHRSPSMDGDRRHSRFSPPMSSMMSSQHDAIRAPYMPTPNYVGMTMVEKLSVLRQVISNLIVVSENEGREVMQIINSLTQSLLQYKIRVLPPQLQDTLARHIIAGDTQGLESTLGLGGSGMSNVGSVISSMAASGDLPMRNMRRGMSPPFHQGSSRMGAGGMGALGVMGGPSSSDGPRNPWGLGPRMTSPMRGGFPTAYPSTSQWQGMGNTPFRGSDRSSFGY